MARLPGPAGGGRTGQRLAPRPALLPQPARAAPLRRARRGRPGRPHGAVDHEDPRPGRLQAGRGDDLDAAAAAGSLPDRRPGAAAHCPRPAADYRSRPGPEGGPGRRARLHRPRPDRRSGSGDAGAGPRDVHHPRGAAARPVRRRGDLRRRPVRVRTEPLRLRSQPDRRGHCLVR